MNHLNIDFMKRYGLILLLAFIFALNGTAQDIRTIEYIKGDALLIDVENMHMLTVNVRFDAVKDYDSHRVLSMRLKAFEYQSGEIWDRVKPLLNSKGENGWVQQDCKGYDFEPAWTAVMNSENTPEKIKTNMKILIVGFKELPQGQQFTVLWVLSNTLIIIW